LASEYVPVTLPPGRLRLATKPVATGSLAAEKTSIGLLVARATGGTQQPWVSTSPIDGSFYFVGPEPAHEQAVATVAPPAAEQAAQAWSAVKDTTSQAVLEDFIRRYDDTIYATLAKARLDELKRSHVATSAARPPPAKLPSLEPPAPSPDARPHRREEASDPGPFLGTRLVHGSFHV
jgi:hypothetical protein